MERLGAFPRVQNSWMQFHPLVKIKSIESYDLGPKKENPAARASAGFPDHWDFSVWASGMLR